MKLGSEQGGLSAQEAPLSPDELTGVSASPLRLTSLGLLKAVTVLDYSEAPTPGRSVLTTQAPRGTHLRQGKTTAFPL